MISLAALLYGDEEQAHRRLTAQAPSLLAASRAGALGVVVPAVELALAISSLLRTPVGDLAVLAWERERAVRAACEASRRSGGRQVVRLLEHTVSSTQRPTIDIDAGPIHGTLLTLTLEVEVAVVAAQLVIEGGRMTGIYPGPASASATLSVGQVVLARRQVISIDLSPPR